MWTYRQRTGEFLHEGEVHALCYSGHGEGKNNPDMQSVRNVGPIPRGAWYAVGPPADTAKHGPFVLQLLPEPGTETFDRNAFLLHGESVAHPGEASEGCICAPRQARERFWQSGDWRILVTE